MDVQNLLEIFGALLAALGLKEAGWWSIGKIRNHRNRKVDLNEIEDENLKPVTQIEWKNTKENIISKMEDNNKRLENMDNAASDLRLSVKDMAGDVKELRAGLNGRIHSISREESRLSRQEHELSFHKREN